MEANNSTNGLDPFGLRDRIIQKEINGSILLYYDAVWGDPEYIGILDPASNRVRRGNYSVDMERLIDETTSKFTTSDWFRWFEVNGVHNVDIVKEYMKPSRAPDGTSSLHTGRCEIDPGYKRREEMDLKRIEIVAEVGVAVSPLGLPFSPSVTATAASQIAKTGGMLPAKAASEKVINYLAKFTSKRFQIGGEVLQLDKAAMKHILERHHPLFWSGEVKTLQGFFHASTTSNGIEDIVSAILTANRDLIIKNGSAGTYQLPETVVNGVTYVLGICQGRIGQLYPK
jgi:hypothetical protein